MLPSKTLIDYLLLTLYRLFKLIIIWFILWNKLSVILY